MEYLMLGLDEIKFDSYNPRKDLKPTDSEYQKIKNSIETFGLVQPFVVNSDNTLISGHQRFKVCKELGIEVVSCVVLDIDKTKEKALNIALNKITGVWDLDKLSDLIDELNMSDFNFDFGFDDFEMTELQDQVQNISITNKVDEEKKEQKEATKENNIKEQKEAEKLDNTVIETRLFGVKYNDVWRLGDHYMACIDSSNSNLVNSFMAQYMEQGTKINLFHIDPPYGMNKDGIENDNLKGDKLIRLIHECIKSSYDYWDENASFYCWGNDIVVMEVYYTFCKPFILNNKMTFRNIITWDKGHGRGQNSEIHKMYATADEKLLFTVNGVNGFNTNADYFPEVFEPIRSLLNSEREKMKWSIKDIKKICGLSEKSGDHWFGRSQWEIIPEKYFKMLSKAAKGKAFTQQVYNEYLIAKNIDGDNYPYFDNTHDNFNNVWKYHVENALQEKKEAQNFASPKPIFLMNRILKTSCKPGGIVLDVFGGSGSTMMAAEYTGRKSILFEILPENCEIILNRYSTLFENKIEKVGVLDG